MKRNLRKNLSHLATQRITMNHVHEANGWISDLRRASKIDSSESRTNSSKSKICQISASQVNHTSCRLRNSILGTKTWRVMLQTILSQKRLKQTLDSHLRKTFQSQMSSLKNQLNNSSDLKFKRKSLKMNSEALCNPQSSPKRPQYLQSSSIRKLNKSMQSRSKKKTW